MLVVHVSTKDVSSHPTVIVALFCRTAFEYSVSIGILRVHLFYDERVRNIERVTRANCFGGLAHGEVLSISIASKLPLHLPIVA